MRNARRIRERKEMTLEQVAGRTSIKFSNLSRFERGEVNLGLTKLQELAAFYDTSIDDLIREVEPAVQEAQG